MMEISFEFFRNNASDRSDIFIGQKGALMADLIQSTKFCPASWINSALLVTPIFFITFARWTSTVFGLGLQGPAGPLGAYGVGVPGSQSQ
jgi:hypothetical protein